VLLYVFQKKSFRPTQDGIELVYGFLLYVFSSLIKGRLDPDFVFIVFFLEKMVIQKTKKILFL